VVVVPRPADAPRRVAGAQRGRPAGLAPAGRGRSGRDHRVGANRVADRGAVRVLRSTGAAVRGVPVPVPGAGGRRSADRGPVARGAAAVPGGAEHPRRRRASVMPRRPRPATVAAAVATEGDSANAVPVDRLARGAVLAAGAVIRHPTATEVPRRRRPATVRACRGRVPARASGGCGRRSRMSLPDRRGLARRPVFKSCDVQGGHCPAVFRERDCVSPVPRTYDCTKWFQLHDRHTSTT
jgi:hypothetical protein